MKVCSNCKIQKEFNLFYKNSHKKDGYRNHCIQCEKESYAKNKKQISIRRKQLYTEEKKNKGKRYYQKNKKSITKRHRQYVELNKEILKEKRQTYAKNNRKKINQLAKQYRLKNIDKYKQRDRLYKKKNRKKINERRKKKLKTDINFKLSCYLRNRLNEIINIKNIKKTKNQSHVKLLGCSIEELKKHIESQFQQGMTWDNHSRNGWHIDHIIPLSRVDITREEEIKKVCHYTNLQPLWAIDNLTKGNKI